MKLNWNKKDTGYLGQKSLLKEHSLKTPTKPKQVDISLEKRQDGVFVL